MSGARILTVWDHPPDPLWAVARCAVDSGDAVCASCDAGIQPTDLAAMILDDSPTAMALFLCTTCGFDKARSLRLGAAVADEDDATQH